MIRTRQIGMAMLAILTLVATAGVAMAAQPGPAYLAVDSFTADTSGDNLVALSATTNGAVPRSADAFIGSELIVGIAWADLDTGRAVVATIHPVLGRDSHQRPDTWHVHTVRLTGGASSPNDFCLVEVASTPTAGIRIVGSSVTVRLRDSAMPVGAEAIDASVGFTVHAGDAGCTTGLGVRVRT